MAELRRAAPALEVRGLDVYYGHSHALQGVDLTLDSGVFSEAGRNGMGKTTLCKTIMGLLRASGGSVRVRGEDITRLSPARIAKAGVGVRPARTAAVAFAQRGRASEPRCRHAARRVDHRSHLRDVSPPRRTQGPRRRTTIGRRTADAGDLARAADQPAAAHHGRADRGARARHRRPGRGNGGPARRRRRDVGAGDRAEHRRRHRDLEERRDHGQWPDQPDHRLRAPVRRPRVATTPARRRRRWRPRRAGVGYRRRRCRQSRGTARAAARRGCGANPDLHLQSHAADALVTAGADRAHRGRRAYAVDGRGSDRRRGTAETPDRRGGARHVGTTRRPRRRYARHQGRGTAFHPRCDRRARLADAAGRRLDERQAFHLRCLGARNSAEPRPRRIRRIRRRSRCIGDGDGGRFCKLAAPPGQHRWHHLGRRFRRGLAASRPPCAPCPSACQSSSSPRSRRAMSALMSAPPTSP